MRRFERAYLLWSAAIASWGDVVRSSARAKYALLLAGAGLALLLGGSALARERQRAVETVAARIVPFDDQYGGFYVIDTSSFTPAMWTGTTEAGLHVPWWLVVLITAASIVYAWRIYCEYRRNKFFAALRYRRPRAQRIPARVQVKRQQVLAALADKMPSAATSLTVRQLMSESTVIAPPSSSLLTLMNLLASAPTRHVLICDAGGRLVGIVADRDVRHRRGKRAVDVMSRPPICVPPGALLGPATQLMVDHQISCLPVVEDGRVRGALTADDVALALECILHSQDIRARQQTAVDETVVLAQVQGICDTVRVNRPAAPAASESESPSSSPVRS